MSNIHVESLISSNTRPRISIRDKSTDDNGNVYPASVTLTFIHDVSYIDRNGDEQEGEHKYTVKVSSDSIENCRELQKVLKSVDFSKYPLQLVCEPFKNESVYKDGKLVHTEKDKFKANCKKSASDLLKILKKQ